MLRRRVLTELLRELGLANPSYVYVKALEELLTAGPSARLDLPGGLQARRDYDRLLFSPPAPTIRLPETPLAVPGRTELPDGLGTIVCSVTKSSYFSHKKLTTFVLKYDMIALRSTAVRGRRAGDRLRLSGGTKSVKDLMIDRKIPAQLRGAVPVLTVDGKPVAVFGVGADPAYLAESGEQAAVFALGSELFGVPDPESPNREEEVNE